jgi:hypothetical protein
MPNDAWPQRGDDDAEEQTQGPNALTGAAAAEEEASAQERMMRRPSRPTRETGPTWRGLIWRAFETVAPTIAAYVLPADPVVLVEPHLAMTQSNIPNEECSICLAPLGSCITTPCGHHFHAACLEHYFNTSRQPGQRSRCPYCRCSVHAPLPVEVRATSGRPIEAIAVPARGGRCHFDRTYCFLSLGDFARPGMLYLLSCNEDRKTPATEVMWVLELSVPCTIHLNYRSSQHVAMGQQEAWLAASGFAPNGGMRSPSSTGVPNGPYSGPTFSRVCQPGTVHLMGSACWEGAYFAFIELQTSRPVGGAGAGAARPGERA